MKIKSCLFAMGLTALSSFALAGDITVAGPVDFGGAVGVPENTTLTGLNPLAAAKYFGPDVTINSGYLVSMGGITYPSEACFRIENSAVPGAYVTNFTNTTGGYTTFNFTVGEIRTWKTNGHVAAILPAGSTWTVECYESYDDTAGAADSQGFDIDLNFLSDTPPPPPPTAPPGDISFDGPVNFGGAVGSLDNTILTGINPVVTAKYYRDNVTLNGGLLESNANLTYAGEIRLNVENSAVPGIYVLSPATGGTYSSITLVPGTTLDWTTNPGVAAILPVGSTFTVECSESYDDDPGADSVGYGISFDFLTTTAPPGPGPGDTPTLAIDLGTVTNSNPLLATINSIAAGKAKWYKFTVGNVDGNLGDWLSIWTGETTDDTEIGMYTDTGDVVTDDDDDSNTGLQSYILIGTGGDPAGPGYDGGTPDPFTLSPGTYYLAIGKYNSQFNGGFGFTSTGTATTSSMGLHITTSIGSGGGSGLSGNLLLGDTIFANSLTRSINYEVKQGLATIASGTINANASSMPYSINTSNAVGPATITFSGASFLTKIVSLTLTGSAQTVPDTLMFNGDVDDSGEVDAADIDNVIANFGQNWPGGVGNPLADVDVSGEVDAADIDAVIANFGNSDDQ